MKFDQQTTFVPIRQAAEALGVPLAWLRRQSETGRVPAVRAGKRWFVHWDRARAALAEQAETTKESHP
jgi:hypothetical protein